MGIVVVSCSKSSNDTEPLRDYDAQYTTDLATIEKFMQTHYMTVTNNLGGIDDQNVTFTLIPEGGTQTSIWSQNTYPILTRLVTLKQSDNVERTYKMYYIKLREGSGLNSKSPSNVDRVLTAYKGEYIFESVTTVGTVETRTIISNEFETIVNPAQFFLTSVIRGWSEIFPQFKTGNYTSNSDGTISYNDFGAGIMFIPSGLGYYGSAQGGIPAYSPLVFNFKLFEVQRVDNDGDGIDSYLEDKGSPGNPGVADGYVYSLAKDVVNNDDTDGDEIPDFLDIDDDGDNYTTKSETSYKNPAELPEKTRYYPFSGKSVDDPLTPYVDETKGVPDCTNDFTSPTRIRKYLNPMCH